MAVSNISLSSRPNALVQREVGPPACHRRRQGNHLDKSLLNAVLLGQLPSVTPKGPLGSTSPRSPSKTASGLR